MNERNGPRKKVHRSVTSSDDNSFVSVIFLKWDFRDCHDVSVYVKAFFGCNICNLQVIKVIQQVIMCLVISVNREFDTVKF